MEQEEEEEEEEKWHHKGKLSAGQVAASGQWQQPTEF